LTIDYGEGIDMNDKTNNLDDPSHELTEDESLSSSEESLSENNEKDLLSKDNELLQLKQQVDDHWDKVLRLQAELENLRKRTLKDIESASRGSIERVFQEILPIMDSFELGMKVDTSNKEGIETFIEGQTATYKQFQSVLDKFLIETINPENMKFDAELHEVMTMQESDEVDSGYIIEVIQKGYRLKNRLLRPARVIVSSDEKK
jgi:molecular chaperone GrpE